MEKTEGNAIIKALVRIDELSQKQVNLLQEDSTLVEQMGHLIWDTEGLKLLSQKCEQLNELTNNFKQMRKCHNIIFKNLMKIL